MSSGADESPGAAVSEAQDVAGRGIGEHAAVGQAEQTIARLVPVSPVVGQLITALVQRVPEQAVVAIEAAELAPAERDRLLEIARSDLNMSQMAEAFGDVFRAQRQDLNADAIECYRAAFYLSGAWEEMAASNPLFARFTANKAYQPFDKWVHYFDIYQRSLAPYVGKAVRVLEIGVFHGGGLDQLRALLGPDAVLVGADVDPAARDACAGRFEVAIGDQTDPEFLAAVVAEFGPFDVIIDDGGHSMRQQITAIEHLFPTLNEGGLYLVEDTHTSYWPGYQDADQTFMDWVKDRVDDVNGYHRGGVAELPIWTTHVAGVHVYDSVVVFDKERRFPPFCEVTGTGSFALTDRISESTLLTYRAALNTALTQQESLRVKAEELGESFNERHERVQALEAEIERLKAERDQTLGKRLGRKLHGGQS